MTASNGSAAGSSTAPQTGTPLSVARERAKTQSHQEALLDESLEESFPASDPSSPKQVS
jgi:hypothetical protein